ncbi:uncharacterized protein LOC110457249 [Mizuhopecten yessoensis]|uniref:Histone deacetylase domain-containing protein n=1 Tax=Mizuhopecten yessoensis TaxID=6573 RepID=A0A210Q9D2_MIZYE|nr:uncharacterized protein LOC110457249 [Mizuhopecten yessoensis]OWF45289.1 hypothetical protein KP79_PYT12736 [Mizuhopecten yessoensis]
MLYPKTTWRGSYSILRRSKQTWKKWLSTLNITDHQDMDYIHKVKRSEIVGLPIVHHHGYVSDLPIKHRFAMRKFHGVMRYLRKDNVISAKQMVEPTWIETADMCTVHTEDYVHKFLNGLTTKQEQRITGFEWNPGLVSRCRYETGGTLLAAKLALERGVACSTGGGTHHAFPEYGSGYCLINDLAIVAATLIRDKMVDKVLIVDLDVHQGDGTAVMFQHNDDVFTFSMHCGKNFPHRKQLSDLDIELDPGTQDEEFLESLSTHLPWVINSFRPNLILFDAGVDPHVKDELGKLNLSDQGLFDRDSFVISTALNLGIPIATVIGGGYQRDLDVLSRKHTIVHRAAMKIWSQHNMAIAM